jgi:hypothetical protein
MAINGHRRASNRPATIAFQLNETLRRTDRMATAHASASAVMAK